MAQAPIYLTKEGEKKLRAELAELTGPRREELSQRLRSAIQMGDLSENADYHKAKEDQGFLEGRIQDIEGILRMAVIIEKKQSDVVTVGAHVTVQEEDLIRKPMISLVRKKPTRPMEKYPTNPRSGAR